MTNDNQLGVVKDCRCIPHWHADIVTQQGKWKLTEAASSTLPPPRSSQMLWSDSTADQGPERTLDVAAVLPGNLDQDIEHQSKVKMCRPLQILPPRAR